MPRVRIVSRKPPRTTVRPDLTSDLVCWEGVAHDVYRNVTLEKLALLRALQAENERRQVFDGLFASTLNELKVDLSVRLRDAARTVRRRS
jgi:hypothetical protein